MDPKALEGGRMVSHISEEQWQAYLDGEMEQEESQQLEYHLYECDLCLHTYMDVVAQQPNIPEWSGTKEWVDHLIETESAKIKQKNDRETKHKDGFHIEPKKLLLSYTIAASITLLLMGLGVFEALLVQTDTSISLQEESYSEKTVQWVTNWLDAVLHHK